MLGTTSNFTLVGALVGASAYAHPLLAAAAIPAIGDAMAKIRRAQVDIYCDHNGQAITAIREAGRQLRASSSGMMAVTLAMLDEAAWLVRHNDYRGAEEALDAALAHLRVDLPRP